MIDPSARSRLVSLLKELSFERKRVILASGRESDFFIDCKQTILTAEGHVLVGRLMFEASSQLPMCEAVAGVELGGSAGERRIPHELSSRPTPGRVVCA